MNSYVQNEYDGVEETQALIWGLLDDVPESAFDYSPGGTNPTIRGLLRELAQTEIAYTRSFRDWVMSFDEEGESPVDLRSAASIRAGFTTLHEALKEAVASVSDADFPTRWIDRGGFQVTPMMQIQIYREAILIIVARISVYLRVLGLPLPAQWVSWIG